MNTLHCHRRDGGPGNRRGTDWRRREAGDARRGGLTDLRDLAGRNRIGNGRGRGSGRRSGSEHNHQTITESQRVTFCARDDSGPSQRGNGHTAFRHRRRRRVEDCDTRGGRGEIALRSSNQHRSRVQTIPCGMQHQSTRHKTDRRARHNVARGVRAAVWIGRADDQLRIVLKFEQDTGSDFDDNSAVFARGQKSALRKRFADFGIRLARNALNHHGGSSLGEPHGAGLGQNGSPRQHGKD